MHRFFVPLAAAAFLTVTHTACAQVMVAPPPYSMPYQQPANGYSPSRSFAAPPQQGQPFPVSPMPQYRRLPKGINRLYALQGNNELLMFGDQHGYHTAMELVKLLDGDLAIISTQVALVQTDRTDLTALGVKIGTDGSLSAKDIQKLVCAQTHGQMVTSDVERIVTREDTAVDVQIGPRSELSLILVPRIESGGRLGVQLTEPVSVTASALSGATTVVALPPAGPGQKASISLLFLTPRLLPKNYGR